MKLHPSQPHLPAEEGVHTSLLPSGAGVQEREKLPTVHLKGVLMDTSKRRGNTLIREPGVGVVNPPLLPHHTHHTLHHGGLEVKVPSTRQSLHQLVEERLVFGEQLPFLCGGEGFQEVGCSLGRGEPGSGRDVGAAHPLQEGNG